MPAVAATPAAPEKTDLEKYLLLPQEPMHIDVLAWWKLHDHGKPADSAIGRPEGLPHLARMARKWLGCPATSADVERLFSKAGSMHHDLKGSMEDGSGRLPRALPHCHSQRPRPCATTVKGKDAAPFSDLRK